MPFKSPTNGNIQATALRDAGEVDAAKKLLNQNVIELRSIQAICVEQQVTEVIPELELNINLNYTQADYVEGKDWNRGRKIMRAQQNQIQSQQVQPSPPPTNNQ